jgi:pilus assembly protein Flp/PilA
MRTLKQLHTDEQGSTGMEYALIASLVSVGIIAALIAFAGSASDIWNYASTAITTALN